MKRKGLQKIVIYIMLAAILLSGMFMGVAGLGSL